MGFGQKLSSPARIIVVSKCRKVATLLHKGIVIAGFINARRLSVKDPLGTTSKFIFFILLKHFSARLSSSDFYDVSCYGLIVPKLTIRIAKFRC
jgi:hypothetical protein